MAIFLFGAARLALKYRRGRARAPVDSPLERASRATKVVATHAWIRRRDPLSGLAHLLVFYGFVVLFIGTGILAFQDDFAEPVLGWFFWHGLVLPRLLALPRRLRLRARRRDHRLRRQARPPPAVPALLLAPRRARRPRSPDEARLYRTGDWIFLGSLFFLALTGFLLEAFRIAADDPSFEVWAPFGWLVGHAFMALGLEGSAAESARATIWWVHGVFALFWVSSIPFTKAVHMLAGPAGVAVKDERAGNRLAPLPPNVKPEEVGYATIDALAPKHLLDLDACTKCGKCHAACPATATRLSALAARPRPRPPRGGRGRDGEPGRPAASRRGSPSTRSSSGRSSPTRSGRACSAWRASRSARLASSTCRSSTRCAARSSSGARWTGSSSRRSRRSTRRATRSARRSASARRWAKELDFEVKDIRKEPAEILWFVGDYASFDPRNQRVTRSLARILRGGRRRLRDPLRRRANRRERRPAGGRGGPLDVAGRGERRDHLRLPLRPRSSRPTRTRSTRSRTSTRSSAAAGPSSTTRSSSSSCSNRAGSSRGRASATASPTTTPARSAATTASTTSRAR